MSIEEKVIIEANNYFERNINSGAMTDEPAYNAVLLSQYIQKLKESNMDSWRGVEGWKVLEIGSNYGYNLKYLSDKHKFECYGVDPSDKAILYGQNKWNSPLIHLEQAISNKLPYENDYFDIVSAGFLFCVTPREMIMDTIKEIDRVLKSGGFLALTDFDTQICFKRVNKHNNDMPVFKKDYSKYFSPLGYYLAEKHCYAHGGLCFTKDIQNRVSTQILYKETEQEIYVEA